MHLARLVLRLTIGGLFVAHGTQKLFGWFGGSGVEGTEKMMTALRLEPARLNAYAAGATEAGSGALLAAGLATPVASAGLIGVMTTAIRTVHGPKGFFNSKGGYEFNLVICAALAALAEAGPGRLSLDHALGTERRGTKVALAATAVGVASSAATIWAGRRRAAALAAQAASHPEPAVATEDDGEPTVD